MNSPKIARRAGREGRRRLVILIAAAMLLTALAGTGPAAATAATGGASTSTASKTAEAPPTEAPAAPEPPAAETAAPGTEPVAKLNRRQVIRLQRKLHVPTDGVFGPRTHAAVRRFQLRHHLLADGRPHLRVLALLRIKVRRPPVTTAAPPAPAPAAVQPAIEAAEAALGAPYAAGATGPSSFDCSGLMVFAFGQAGITLPRTSFAQFEVGEEVGLEEIAAGDLVFFDTDGPGASHVGIALSPETAISATDHGVMEHPLAGGYWGEHLIGARRLS